MFRLATSFALLLNGAAAIANDESNVPAEYATAVAAAEMRGKELYLYDQAAWHGTDSFVEAFDMSGDTSFMRGYVVLPKDDGLLDTVFYGEIGGKLVEVARYTVDGSEVVSGQLFAPDKRPELSPLAVKLAQARKAALDEAAKEKIRLCADATPNTIVLPPDAGGAMPVYILTPPTSNDSYPLGGHYKFDVGADGKASPAHSFLEGCFDIMLPHPSKDTVGMVVTTVPAPRDAQPTEIHVFTTYYRRYPLFVSTEKNGLGWVIDDGKINQLSEFNEADVQD